MLISSRLLLFCMAFIAVGTGQAAVREVVINEIHYDPDIKTELVEFVELHNTGDFDIDLSGWHFTGAVFYQFDADTVLDADGYLIVAFNPDHIHAKWSSGRFGIPADVVFGPFEGRLDNAGETIRLRDTDGEIIDRVDYQLGFPWPTVGDAVPEGQPGTGNSIQLVNPLLDNDLSGSWRSALPTPAAFNHNVYLQNTPPHIRQVRHSPKQPKSQEAVTISAKVTDSDGVASVTLQYQVVEPGSYINLDDGQYRSNWTDLAMLDDGTGPDEEANDDVYTVQLPGSLQKHRRLIRYRILMVDGERLSLMVPYSDDPQPNFAYFVYDGVPAWRGAVRPGSTPVIEYGADVMRSLPVYHLISKKTDVETATWFEHYAGSDYKWYGTLVYDGEVYDHIRYRARGGVWRYAMGKNMWKFNFDRGHRFQARDDYGKKYEKKWDKLNFSACIQQGSFGQRGEHGMFEALSNKLFNMAGVPASRTNWVQFRVVDERYEDGTRNAAHPPLTGSGTQYDGDFWGVYMTLEQMDGRFLDEHDLPDGNLYKMDQAYPQGCKLNNQGPTGVTDKSDVLTFRSGFSSRPRENWWGSNVNLQAYYSLRAIYNAVHHGDITSKNHYFYLNPEPTVNEYGINNLWWQLPWDVDLTWTCYYRPNHMEDPFTERGNILRHNELNVAAKNRVREICDLLFNPEQTNHLIDEFAAVINDPQGGLSIVDADRSMWDYHWVMSSGAYPKYLNRQASFKAGQGRFYQEAVDRGYQRSFEAMVQVMKDYVVERGSHMESISRDPAIPNTPVLTSTSPADYPINALTFETGPFSDPQGGNSFAAVKWRIAEVNPGSQPAQQNDNTALIQDGDSWRYFKGTQEPPSARGVTWREPAYEDSSWLRGHTPIGYGEPFIATNLGDMRGRYSTLYLRKTFEVANVNDLGNLVLEAKYDDGVNIWINGIHAASGNTHSAELPYNATVDNRPENHNFTNFFLGEPHDYLVSGTNVVAVQVINSYLSNSSDCFIDIRLSAEAVSEGAAPAAPPNYNSKPGKYEIDAVWESEELADATERSIQIPATTVRVGRTYRVRCRMKDNADRWSHWSAPVQFVTGEPISAGIIDNLRITELMYNPADPPAEDGRDNDEFEFVELTNTGDETLDLTDVSFTDGIAFDFGTGRVRNLAPGEFVLVVRNESAFQSRYGTALSAMIAGEYAGKLSNGGERIILSDFWNGTVAEFIYNDTRGWPLSADGAGHSLVPLSSALLNQHNGSFNYGGNWRPSTYIGGSPGFEEPQAQPTIVLNEIKANTDYSDPSHPGLEPNDWIELYNVASASINLNHWYLSDDIDDLKKWAVPAIEIAGESHISFDEITDFGLSKSGEQAVLSYLAGTHEDRVVDYVRFKGQSTDASLGRFPDGGPYWVRMRPSRDLTNEPPISGIVVNEIMYHPADDIDIEYIELYNPMDSLIHLGDADGLWRLDGAVDYTFPADTLIDAGSRLVVVGFDPIIDKDLLSAFVAAYDGADGDIVGPWSGNLSNGGERLALERPGPPDETGNPTSWIIVDEVIYADVPPWPASADGAGDTLQRIQPELHLSGNDPGNWRAATPTPGD